MRWDLSADLDVVQAILTGRAGTWVMVLARSLGLCLTAPGLAVPGLPWRFRLAIAGMLGVVLVPIVGEQVAAPPGWGGLAWGILGELLVGGILGMAAGLIVAGARAAGDLVAAQAGLSITSLLDPEAGEELTPLGRLYGLVALAAFLALGGPLALVGALAESYTASPAGRIGLSTGMALSIFGQVGRTLELALRAAAPPAVALIMAGIALAWLSRTAPSIPFLMLAMPVRLVVGTLLTLLGVAALIVTFTGAWEGLLGIR
jgi:flagellar biosynthesis protein FliR